LQSFSCSSPLTNDTVFDAMVDRVLVNGDSENEGSSTNQIVSVAN